MKKEVIVISVVLLSTMIIDHFFTKKNENEIKPPCTVNEEIVAPENRKPLDLSFERFEALAKMGENWLQIDEGLYIGRFMSEKRSDVGDSVITVIKVDPEKYELKLLSAAQKNHPSIPADQWAEEHNLILVTNAGMFDTDFTSHVGYMRNFEYANNEKVHPRYHSMAAFNSKEGHDRVFYIYDSEDTNIESLNENYNSIVQNLRLVKRPGENRWSPQRKMWSEAALGQDSDGNILFIFSRYFFKRFETNFFINFNIIYKFNYRFTCKSYFSF
jgi:hypothetical protein